VTAIDLRLGRWEDVLADVTCDALITDPPYGARTHESAPGKRSDGYSAEGSTPGYDAWTPADVAAFVSSWSPRVRGWMLALTSHDLIPAWENAYSSVDRQFFAPVACVMNGSTFRQLADGPSSWTVYAMVARPRGKEWVGSGGLPGAYTGPRSVEAGGGRGKPAWLVSAFVRDYSKPGDLIADPLAGWGGTAAAATGAGRSFVGAECDAAAHGEAVRRLSRGVQMDLLAGPPAGSQRVRKRRANGERR
jgi:hypothetical protein